MKEYIIASTDRDIWAINPDNKRMFNLVTSTPENKWSKRRGYNLLDTITTDKNVYYSVEEEAIVKFPSRKYCFDWFKYNYVLVIDSLLGKPVKKIIPNDDSKNPFENKIFDIDFHFFKKGYDLYGVLNGESVIVDSNVGYTSLYPPRIAFPEGRRIATLERDFPPYLQESDYGLIVDRNKLFLEGRRIASLNGDIKKVSLINKWKFNRSCEKKSTRGKGGRAQVRHLMG